MIYTLNIKKGCSLKLQPLWRIPESNRSPFACHANALPNELIPLSIYCSGHLPAMRDALPNELAPKRECKYNDKRCKKEELPPVSTTSATISATISTSTRWPAIATSTTGRPIFSSLDNQWLFP